MKTYYSYRYAHMGAYACRAQSEKSMRIGEYEYFGQVCKKCDTNLRYAKDRKCVLCSEFAKVKDVKRALAIASGTERLPIETMHSDRVVRKLAALAGLEMYQGCRCDKCGNGVRYTLRGRCVECVDGRNATYRLAMGMKPCKVKKKPAPARTEAGDYDRLFE